METLEAQTPATKPGPKRTVLVAVDLSVHSEATTSYAAELAKGIGASLSIVHVHKPVPVYECGNETTYTLLDDQRCNLKKRLNELMQKVRRTGLACESVYLVGEPATEISAFARDVDADLIVTASHHPTFLERLFNLDKAPQIMHRAPCPVLIYHQKDLTTQQGRRAISD